MMASKEKNKHTKKHFQSEIKKKELTKKADTISDAARHHPSKEQNRKAKMASKKLSEEENRQSRRLSRNMGLK